jgi:putative peptide zinc metalloprotease protein
MAGGEARPVVTRPSVGGKVGTRDAGPRHAAGRDVTRHEAGFNLRPSGEPVIPERPILHSDVTVHEPTEPGKPWVVQRGDHQYFRVGADMARFLSALDGRSNSEGIARQLGAPWTVDRVRMALGKAATMRLLDDGQRRPKRRRITFVLPLTVQLTVLNPAKLLGRLRGLINVLSSQIAVGVIGFVLVAGSILTAANLPAVTSALGKPLSFSVYLWVLIAILATTCLHEWGHGSVLTRHGGTPHRMGVMLFYGAPAFFCDVSDGWRLPRSGQRVQVALAGVAVQTTTASVAAIVAAFLPAGDARDVLWIFVISCAIQACLNLLPFVKLDGYIALMSHLDIPFLREKAMSDARAVIAGVLFGAKLPRQLPGRPWAVPYGLACLLFPLYLVVTALILWQGVLAGFGVVGAVLLCSVVAWVLYRSVRSLTVMVRAARATGGSPWRIAGVLGVLVAAAVCLLSFVRVPYTATGGYTATADSVQLVVPSGTDPAAVEPGSTVTFNRSGIVTSTELGSGVIGNEGLVDGSAPLSAVAPLTLGDLEIPAQITEVENVSVNAGRQLDTSGAAEIKAGDKSVAQWAYLTYVSPLVWW